jgi:hypothetical protein
MERGVHGVAKLVGLGVSERMSVPGARKALTGYL